MYEEINRSGSAAFIAAQRRGGGIMDPEKHFAGKPAPFPFLLDEDRKVTKAYGVYKMLGIDSINIARPATFVINRQGAVSFIYIGNTQFDRAPLQDVLAALNSAA